MHSWKAPLTEILDEGAYLGGRLNHLLQLRRNQWKKKKELEKIQLKRLKAIVRHACDHVPYYHRLLDSIKFKPRDLKDLEDLRKIPITTKLDLKKNYPNIFIKGTDYSKYQSLRTSGSTGIRTNSGSP